MLLRPRLLQRSGDSVVASPANTVHHASSDAWQTQGHPCPSHDYGTVNCQMAVVCRYHKGRRHQHGIQYLLFVVYRVKVTTQQLPQHHRGRFGIETSYRLQNSCRIRTTTRHPVVRLLFVALAFVLVNLWLWLLWSRLSLTHRGGRRVYQVCFRLKTMLEFLHHAIERHFPLLYSLTLPVLGGRL